MQSRKMKDQLPDEPLIDKRAVAALLGISPFSVNRIMADIGYVRVGRRRVMFEPKKVRDYIERKTVSG